MRSFFITGTDTEVGKTYVTVQLLKQLNQQGYSTFGIKPIASEASTNSQGELVNDDALQLQATASFKTPYSVVNPIIFEPAIAPHIAAEQCGKTLTKNDLTNAIRNSLQQDADINLIEGAGGWHLPLTDGHTLADVIKELNIPVILVVGIKLGCLNHAILTCQAIQQANVPLVGWVANCIDPNMLASDENIRTLKAFLPAPCLGVMPYDGISHLTTKNLGLS